MLPITQGTDDSGPMVEEKEPQGRIGSIRPVAVIDIGSNSVRLVVFEGATRSPAPLFNEKILCGLGRNLATTGRLNEKGVERALRFGDPGDVRGILRLDLTE